MHWLTIIGIVLIAIGTFISVIGQNIDSKINSKKLNEKNDSLMTQNSNLLNQNETLMDKIDNYQDDIEIKNMKIQELEKNAQKLTYKSLDNKLKKVIISELIEIKKVSDVKFKDINFKIDFGTIDRNKNTGYIVRDLRSLFTEAGYNTTKPSNKTVINPNLKIYTIPVIIVNPKYEELAINITISLKKYLTNLKYVTDSSNKYATLKFQFYGIPEFSKDGKVTYQ